MAAVATMNFLENRTFGPTLAGFGGTTSRFGSRGVTWPLWCFFSMSARAWTALSFWPELAYQCGVSCIAKISTMP